MQISVRLYSSFLAIIEVTQTTAVLGDAPPNVDDAVKLVVEPVDLPLPDPADFDDLGPIEFFDLPLPDDNGSGR